MKKSFLPVLLILCMVGVNAQNIQLLYGKDKGKWFYTSTVEMFKPDKLGNTFFFIDFTYGNDGIKGVNSAYMEIARAFSLGKSPFAFHVEYNGGLGNWKSGDEEDFYTINNSWMTGLEYSINNKDFTRGITFQVLYKYIQGKHKASFQLTEVWYLNLFHNKFTFSGFADFWREDNYFGDETTRFIFQTQPQAWYNLNPHFSVGSEVQLAYNFATVKKFDVFPSAAVKYTF
jgi:hypothetical protein